ncbi:MAG: T9SS type A sorting domain-containing protein [Gemmatimonadetes bacterium]|nr:T9SS type A sorting domain-containing protein [Gemmatimonadota bacterium]
MKQADSLRARKLWEHELLELAFVEKVLSPATAFESSLLSASHSVNGDVRSRLQERDGEEVTIAPGEWVDLVFEATPMIASSPDLRFALRSTGYYIPGGGAALSSPKSRALLSFELTSANPSFAGARMRFLLARETNVRLDVYDVGGRRITRIVNRRLAAGLHSFAWDGSTDAGIPVAPGVYFLRLAGGGEASSVKLIKVRGEPR